MSNEITLTASLSFAKAPNIDAISRGRTALPVTVSGSKYKSAVQNINTTEETVAMGDVAAGGWCYVRNLDSTNYVQLKSGTGVTPFARLKPGEPALFRLDSGATLYAQANTAAVDIEVLLISD